MKDTHPKSKIRVCLDPSNPEKQLFKNLTTTGDFIPELHEAKYFNIIDMKYGYWQVILDKESKLPTTFNTPYGRYCFTRMPIGLNVLGDAFQQKLDEVLAGLQGVTAMAYDIFIYARTEEEHDQNLTNLLNRTRQHRLKIGASKIQYKKTSVEFYGLQFTTNGYKPTDKKMYDIWMMPEPKRCQAVTIISWNYQLPQQIQPKIGIVNNITLCFNRKTHTIHLGTRTY